MKTRIFFSVLLVLTAGVFFFVKPNAKENAITTITLIPSDTIFKICAYDGGWVKNDYTNLHDLGVNTWHKYSEIDSGWQKNIGVIGDIRETPDNSYTGNVRAKIQQNSTNGFISVFDRCKINYLGLAKKSVYECESETSHLPDPDYWFYTYNTHDPAVSEEYQDNTSFGNGIYVRHSSPGLNHTAGYVVKDLKTNREQLWLAYYKDMKWYVLPRIRIDTSSYNYNDTTRVCRIDILKFDSSFARSIILRKSNFAVDTLKYKGKYIYQFYNDSLNVYNYFITFDSLGVINPYPGKSMGDLTCGVDFRIYWYGECEMWIDNITVENQIAYDFWGENSDSTYYNKYQAWLRWEVEDIANPELNNIAHFYFDEFEFCNLPALTKINKAMDSLSNHQFGIIPPLNFTTFTVHLPDYNNQYFTNEQTGEFLIEKSGFKGLIIGAYPFEGYYDDTVTPSPIPNTLPCGNVDYNATIGMLTRDTNTTSYENWLQLNFDYENIPNREIISYKRAKYISQNYTVPFYALVQTHLNNASDGILREPTNEEIAMMTNVSLFFRSLLVF